MDSILDHAWGVSAADRVWCQVSGLRPIDADRRLFMTLQAFMDESDKGDFFSLGGCIASASKWSEFSKEWDGLLRSHGTLSNRSKKYQFKMSDMASNPERMARVPIFFHVIEKHAGVLLSARLNKADLRRAINRIYMPLEDLNWGKWENPWLVCFTILMDTFHARRHTLEHAKLGDGKIDFYFDNRPEKKIIYESWDYYMGQLSPEMRDRYGATPRFEDDTEFLPLQAADFWAWWVRKWDAEGTPEKILKPDFQSFGRLTKNYIGLVDIWADEDSLVKLLMDAAKSEHGENLDIRDRAAT